MEKAWVFFYIPDCIFPEDCSWGQRHRHAWFATSGPPGSDNFSPYDPEQEPIHRSVTYPPFALGSLGRQKLGFYRQTCLSFHGSFGIFFALGFPRSQSSHYSHKLLQALNFTPSTFEQEIRQWRAKRQLSSPPTIFFDIGI